VHVRLAPTSLRPDRPSASLQGNALLFFSAQPDGTPDMDAVHGGCPPTEGFKWIAQQFNLDGNFPTTRRWQPTASGEGQPADDTYENVPAARGGERFAAKMSERALRRLREQLNSE
jgi:hypothetical protein